MLRSRALSRILTITVLVPWLGFSCGAEAQADQPPHLPRASVSLTFDDGFSSQWVTRSMLAKAGLKATFYVNTGFLGMSGRLTTDEVRRLQADGNEIGGHTLSHPHLTALVADEQEREMCDDRAALLALGLRARSFAYPFGDDDPKVELVAKRCGYRSARTVGGLAGSDCMECPRTEGIPPADPFRIRSAVSVVGATRLARLKSATLEAVQRGGWGVFVFHHVCDACSEPRVSPQVLQEFIAWLAGLQGQSLLQVRTVGDVVGGSVQPATRGPSNDHVETVVPNASMEQADPMAAGNSPNASLCWEVSSYGNNVVRPVRSNVSRSGHWSQGATVEEYRTGDVKVMIRRDTGSCALSVSPGQRYTVKTWYRSSAPVRLLAFTRNQAGGWQFWASSPPTGGSPGWEQAEWLTPAVPAGVDHVSYGVGMSSTGELLVDDLSATPRDHPDPATGGELPAVAGGLALCLLLVAAGPTLLYLGARHVRRRSRSVVGV